MDILIRYARKAYPTPFLFLEAVGLYTTYSVLIIDVFKNKMIKTESAVSSAVYFNQHIPYMYYNGLSCIFCYLLEKKDQLNP